MTTKSTVSAIVVTWNSQNDIIACLNSLQRQTYPLKEITLVDNCSHDGTIKIIQECFPDVFIEARIWNEGFAQANNIGIGQTDSEWVLTLNPDVKLAANWVETLLGFAEGKDKIGALGGLLWRWDDKESGIIDSTGIEIFTSRRVRDRHFGAPREAAPGQPEQVFGICAAAALYRREMLEDIAIQKQYFPKRFFCYYEDADLAWRAWRRGWEAWTVPAAQGWHRRGASPNAGHFSRYLTQRNRAWLIIRNDNIDSLLRDAPYIFMHELIMALRILRYPTLAKAVLEAVAGIGEAFKERRELIAINLKAPPFRKGIGFSRKDWQDVRKNLL